MIKLAYENMTYPNLRDIFIVYFLILNCKTLQLHNFKLERYIQS